MITKGKKTLQSTQTIAIIEESNNNYVQTVVSQSKLSQSPIQYQKFFELIQPIIKQQEMIAKLVRNNIRYKQQSTKRQYTFKYEVVKSSKNMQAVLIKIQYAEFQTQISLLNVDKPCQFYNVNSDYRGAFGQINFYKTELQTIAIKSIFLRRGVSLKLILKQYFFNLLFSVLDIGPIVKKWMGFDIILYADCAQISMENCKEIINITDKGKNQYYQQLKFMHINHIIHGDIKPQNMLYSANRDKYITCDYGITRIIHEQIGVKTLTNFFGSYSFASPQMASLLTKFNCSQVQQDYVDLYWNDLYCLIKSINLFSKNQQYLQKQQSQKIVLDLSHQYQLFKMKYYMFSNQCNNLDSQKVAFYKHEIQQFILVLQPTHHLYQFFLKHFGVGNKFITSQTQLKIREFYTNNGVKQLSWLKLCQIHNKNIFQRRINCQFKQQNLNNKAQQLQKIILREDKSQLQILSLYLIYLNGWRENWSQAEKISKHIHEKFVKVSTIKQQVTTIMVQSHNLFPKQILTQNLAYIQTIMEQQQSFQDLINLAQFTLLFLKNLSQYSQIMIKVFPILIRKQVNLVIPIIINFMIKIMTPFNFIFLQEQIFRKILLIVDMFVNYPELLWLRQQILCYYKILQKALENHISQIPFHLFEQIKIPKYQYEQNLSIVRRCVMIRVNLLYYDYKTVQQYASTIQSIYNNLITKNSAKTLITYSFIYLYEHYCNPNVIQLIIEQTIEPQNFKDIWTQRNMISLARRHFILNEHKQAAKFFRRYFDIKHIETLDIIYFLSIHPFAQLCLVKYQIDFFMSIYKNNFEKIQIIVQNKELIEKYSTRLVDYILCLCIIIQKCIYQKIKKDKFEEDLKYLYFLLNHRSDVTSVTNILQKKKIVYFSICQKMKKFEFNEAIYYYQNFQEIIKSDPQYLIKFGVLITICEYNNFRAKRAYELALKTYEIQQQFNTDFIFLKLDFLPILQEALHNQHKIAEYINFFKLLLKKVYYMKNVEFLIIKNFIQKMKFGHFEEFSSMCEEFFSIRYYESTQCCYHNFSVLLLEINNIIPYKPKEKLSWLKCVAMTVDSLIHSFKRFARSMIFILLKLQHTGRKKKSIRQKLLCQKGLKIKKKKIKMRIRSFNKFF